MRRAELADFLRRRREAIRPGDVGLADGPRRRTAGLRREEVALLAGMSVDYVVRLEQGRSSQPSTQLLGALAAPCGCPTTSAPTCSIWPATSRRLPTARPGWPAPGCCAC